MKLTEEINGLKKIIERQSGELDEVRGKWKGVKEKRRKKFLNYFDSVEKTLAKNYAQMTRVEEENQIGAVQG